MRTRMRLMFVALLVALVSVANGWAFQPPVEGEAPGQEVNIPYVVSISENGWWTGISITNDSDVSLEGMRLQFRTATGADGYRPNKIAPFVKYETVLEEIGPRAMLVGTLSKLYSGGIAIKQLPSEYGSVRLYHPGDDPFSVTVYIGGPSGFAYQVFRSHSTSN